MLVSALTLWLLQVFVKPILSAESDLEQAISALRPQLSPGATITFPSDPRWDELNSRASSPRLVPHFSVVVEVAAESDVQATVTVASQYDIPFLAITGRHGWTSSLDKLPYGFQINLRGLNSSALSSDGKTATIGGGIIQYELVRSLFEKGKYAVSGLCECVSIAGPLLGGGHSLLQGQHGYVLDNMISANVVVANGTLVKVSKDENTDLFWAVRGAGHNFGIVTSFDVNAYDVPSNWTVNIFTFAADKLEAVFGLVNEFEEPSSNRPAKLALTGILVRIPQVDPVNPVISYTVAYEGTAAEAEPYAAQFKALDPLSTTTSNVNYIELYTVTNNNIDGPVCARNRNIAGSGISLPAWDLKGLRKAFTVFSNLTADTRFASSVVLMENYGMQGVRAADSTLTSLSVEERERPVLAGPALWWDGDDEQTTQDAYAYIRALRDALDTGVDNSGAKRHAYVNYASGDESRPELYGYDGRLEKLAKLKKVWDPENRFGFYNPVV